MRIEIWDVKSEPIKVLAAAHIDAETGVGTLIDDPASIEASGCPASALRACAERGHRLLVMRREDAGERDRALSFADLDHAGTATHPDDSTRRFFPPELIQRAAAVMGDNRLAVRISGPAVDAIGRLESRVATLEQVARAHHVQLERLFRVAKAHQGELERAGAA